MGGLGGAIYALIVDLTSAFNTTDHDEYLELYMILAFPTDAIDSVRIRYEHATTQVDLPSKVSTSKIPIERGTIQGDTLSIFLFSILYKLGLPIMQEELPVIT